MRAELLSRLSCGTNPAGTLAGRFLLTAVIVGAGDRGRENSRVKAMTFLGRFNLGRALLTRSALGLGRRFLRNSSNGFDWSRCGRCNSCRRDRRFSLERRGRVLAGAASSTRTAVALTVIVPVGLAIVVTFGLTLGLTIILTVALALVPALEPRLLCHARLLLFASAGFQLAIKLHILFVIKVEAIVAIAAPVLLLFLPRAVVGKDAEIMLRELQVIFGVDPVALRLRVARQILVFFKKLGRVAARAAVDAVTRISAPAIALGTRVVPTATAAGLPIIDQRNVLVLMTSQKAPLPDLDAYSPQGPTCQAKRSVL